MVASHEKRTSEWDTSEFWDRALPSDQEVEAIPLRPLGESNCSAKWGDWRMPRAALGPPARASLRQRLIDTTTLPSLRCNRYLPRHSDIARRFERTRDPRKKVRAQSAVFHSQRTYAAKCAGIYASEGVKSAGVLHDSRAFGDRSRRGSRHRCSSNGRRRARRPAEKSAASRVRPCRVPSAEQSAFTCGSATVDACPGSRP